MKTQHEYNVTLNVGKLLKDAGFDWETEFGQHIWDSSKRLETNRNFNSEKYLVSLPTLDEAQKWLRDVKRLFICVIPDIKDYHATWNFYICNLQGLFYEDEDCFLTYEEALEAGITKALEIILDKNYEL